MTSIPVRTSKTKATEYAYTNSGDEYEEDALYEYINDGDDDGSSSWEEEEDDDGGFVGWDHDSRLRLQQQRRQSSNRRRRSRRKSALSTTAKQKHPKSKKENEGDDDSLDQVLKDSNNNKNNEEKEEESVKFVSIPKTLGIIPMDKELWSVRVRFMSAVDLPPNLSPKLPLCPLFQFSLSDHQKITTTCHILSKPHHGAMEWQEEMRWDNVSDPLHTTLTVELVTRTNLSAPVTSSSHDSLHLDQLQITSSASTNANSNINNNSHHNSNSIVNRGTSISTTTSTTSALSIPTTIDTSSQNQATHASQPNLLTQQQDGQPSFLRSNTTDHSLDSSTMEEEPKNGLMRFWRNRRQELQKKREQQRQDAAVATAQFLVDEQAPTLTKPQQPPKLPKLPKKVDEPEPQEDLLAGIIDDSWSRRPRRSTDVIHEPEPIIYNSLVGATELKSSSKPEKPKKKKSKKTKKSVFFPTSDVSLGKLEIPLSKLPLEQDHPSVEKWYPLQVTGSNTNITGTPGNNIHRRCPSILLEISFCSTERLEESEDEADVNIADWDNQSSNTNYGDQQQQTQPEQPQEQQQQQTKEELQAATEKEEGPALLPGIVDFVAVVGAKDLGNTSSNSNNHGGEEDIASSSSGRGWLNVTPECGILEQFPPNDEFHVSHGRNVTLGEKVEWFCWPEGCKIWKGVDAPTHLDMNLKRFSASSPPTMASSIAAFDACLNCTTSFTWFVMTSNTEEYGFRTKKTFGAVIRFYAPAPLDNTTGSGGNNATGTGCQSMDGTTRLWVPLAICMTSSLPIIGILEAMLLRLCEKLASRANSSPLGQQSVYTMIQQDMANVIVNYPRPIPGVINCSIPFLSGDGDRLLVTLPPIHGLPSLPHGASVTSVCRLLGAEGLAVLLAAVLTECKILIHSADVANLAMVAEVVTALMYPFQWQLPYIPVLPEQLLDLVEAPLSYFVGVPSCHMKWIDKSTLGEVVVIDLDNGFSATDYFDGRRIRTTKMATPMPASVSNNISKAVFRLLREEEEVEEQFGTFSSGARHLPRLEGESLAEREFRIAVCQQICGLVRGYQECLFFVSASQPVFNRDRFLRYAPALFEERRTTLSTLHSTNSSSGTSSNHNAQYAIANSGVSAPDTMGNKMVTQSPRSKRFLLGLVNTQQFHALLENLDSDDTAFFHQVMDTLDSTTNTEEALVYGSPAQEEACKELCASLEKVEQRIPTHHVCRRSNDEANNNNDLINSDNSEDDSEDDDDDDDLLVYDLDDGNYMSSFTQDLLQPVYNNHSATTTTSTITKTNPDSYPNNNNAHGQELAEVAKKPWQYMNLFDIRTSADAQDEDEDEEEEATNKEEEEDLSSMMYSGSHSNYTQMSRHRSRRQRRKNIMTSLSTSSSLGPTSNNNRRKLMLMRNSSGSSQKVKKQKPFLIKFWNTIHLKEALGDRKFRKWKQQQQLLTNNNQEDDPHAVTDSHSTTKNKNSAEDTSILHMHKLLQSAVDEELSVVQESPEEDRQMVRLCLQSHTQENLEAAQLALRNSSAQRFLLRVLSQRTACMEPTSFKKSRRWTHHHTANNHPLSQTHQQQSQSNVNLPNMSAPFHSQNAPDSSSRLIEESFDCLVRLCWSMLEACQADEEYETAHKLLTHTAGYCKVNSNTTLTQEISRHSIFSNLNLWKHIFYMHQQDRQQKTTSSENNNSNKDAEDYEAAVSTLYEMLGYGVAAQDLANFAINIAEQRGWFPTERGQKLLVLTRRLSVKREDGESAIWNKQSTPPPQLQPSIEEEKDELLSSLGLVYKEMVWNHPAVDNKSNLEKVHCLNSTLNNKNDDSSDDEQSTIISMGSEEGSCLGRVAITSSASLPDASMLATGGLDGSVFVVTPGNQNAGVRLETTWEDAVSCVAVAPGISRRRIMAGSTVGDLKVWEVSQNGIFSRSLSGHRGGVTCMTVPSHLYRPESLITGGEDGLIKLWSLRHLSRRPSANSTTTNNTPKDKRISQNLLSTPSGRNLFGRTSTTTTTPSSSLKSSMPTTTSTEPQDVLTGHGGKILCVKVAWHGDRLLSGGADRTLRSWDLQQGGSRCLLTMGGHLGWVTHAEYWGPHTMISASTDRTVGLWDARNSPSPLFVLRYHNGPITDLYVGNRDDYQMMTAGADGRVATWDVRYFSLGTKKKSTTIRQPLTQINHCQYKTQSGGVWLSSCLFSKSLESIGMDGIVKTWDPTTGTLRHERFLQHSDVISSYLTPIPHTTITTSWDGTLRYRSPKRKDHSP